LRPRNQRLAIKQKIRKEKRVEAKDMTKDPEDPGNPVRIIKTGFNFNPKSEIQNPK